MLGGCMGRSGPAVLVSDEAVANCHKHSGGNHANALSSSARGQKSKQSLWAKIKVVAQLYSLWLALRGEYIPLFFFQFIKVTYISWLMFFSSTSKASSTISSDLSHFLPPSSMF